MYILGDQSSLNIRFLYFDFKSHPIEIPQWLDAKFDAAPNNDIPIIATAGVIVSGVIKRRSIPMRPEFITRKYF